MTDYSADTLHDGLLELGEGPTYDAFNDILWWFDIAGRQIYAHDFSKTRTRAFELPAMASMMAHLDGEHQLLAMQDGLYMRHRRSGRLRLRTPLEANRKHTRSNDGRTHPCGALWIGTMGRESERDAGAIYWYNGTELRRLYDRITIPNAICFSQDGKIGYFTDNAHGRIMRVQLDASTGLPTSEPAVFCDAGVDEGNPDGAVVDRDGVLWNARWGAGCVNAYAPDGQRIKCLTFGAAQVTCPAFCGARGSDMVVTSAWQGLSANARAQDVQAGNTFIVRGGFNGVFDPPFVPAAE